MSIDIYHIHDGIECPNTDVANRLLAENRKMKAELDRLYCKCNVDPWYALDVIVQTYQTAAHPLEAMHETATKALGRHREACDG